MTRLAEQFKPLNLAIAAVLLILAAGGFLWRSQQMSSGIPDAPRPTGQTSGIYDYARLLSGNETRLNQVLKKHNETYEIETVVVTAAEIPAGMTSVALAEQLLINWNIGKTHNGRGILILVVSDVREVHLSATATLASEFPEHLLHEIQKWPWQAYFQKKNLSDGLYRVLAHIEAEYRKIDRPKSD